MQTPKIHIGINISEEMFNDFKQCFPGHGQMSIILRRMINELVAQYKRDNKVDLQNVTEKVLYESKRTGVI